jgi:hypothetical protein
MLSADYIQKLLARHNASSHTHNTQAAQHISPLLADANIIMREGLLSARTDAHNKIKSQQSPQPSTGKKLSVALLSLVDILYYGMRA